MDTDQLNAPDFCHQDSHNIPLKLMTSANKSRIRPFFWIGTERLQGLTLHPSFLP